MEKIKIFLGAYVNFPNAQNINSDNIAKYLDKDKFEVHAMYTPKMPIDKEAYKEKGIILHKLWHRRFVWKWSKLHQMKKANCNVYYLPKSEIMDVTFSKKHKGKGKVFVSSVEGVVGEQIPADDMYQKTFFNECMDSYFSISACVKESVKKCWDYDSDVLYLGVNQIAKESVEKKEIKNVIWIGSVIDRKRPKLLLDCAKAFPNLNFTMIGDGYLSNEIVDLIEKENHTNVRYLGRIPNDKVYEELKSADLLLMTSDKEGLPKVIAEAMMFSAPSIYINECYNVDYIENGENGFGVRDVEEMKEKVQYLIDNPDVYQKLSKNAFDTVQNYTWSNLIKGYEEWFIKAYEKYGKVKE